MILLQKNITVISLAALLVCMAFCAGCSVNGSPRIRTGSYATATLGTNFMDANNLGRHSYYSLFNENNGMVYTCRGGHIDIAHVRIAADDVRYLYGKVQRTLLKTGSDLTFKSAEAPSKYCAKLNYPENWKNMSLRDRQKIAEEVAFELSQYLAYTMTTWHEVLTWFGYKSTGIFPEFPSAFSWEDNYSNLVGVRIGAKAIRDDKHGYDEAVTIAIKEKLRELGVQSRKVAKEASESVKGKWWEGTPFLVYVDMKERNMDLGYVDGYVTPTLVPGICKDAKPLSLPVPKLETLAKYGFTMEFTVEPKEFEKEKILRIVCPDEKCKKISFPEQLRLIMDYVRAEATHMGYNTMPPKDPVGQAANKGKSGENLPK